MNLLLLWPHEVTGDEVTLSDRRAAHVLGLLAKKAGDSVRVGILGRGTTHATVIMAERAVGQVRLQLGVIAEQPAPQTSVILAVPRPKALSRIVSALSSFGVRHVDLIGAQKVDPAYFSSPRLAPERLLEDALLGLEQGGGVHVPSFAMQRSLHRFALALPPCADDEARVLFDPSGQRDLIRALQEVARPSAHVTLVFGPDGGFVAEELQRWSTAGFQRVALGRAILRTEVAVAAGLGQLDLARAALSGLPDAR